MGVVSETIDKLKFAGLSFSTTLARIEVRNLAQLFIQTTFLSADLLWHHNFQSHKLIAATAPPLVKTLTSEAQALSALRAWWNG
jgi:hypothetical protein